MARPDGFDGAIGVGGETGLRVIAGQVDRDRFVPGLFEERHDTMPVPSNSASTGNENEAGQVSPPNGAQPSLRRCAMRQLGRPR